MFSSLYALGARHAQLLRFLISGGTAFLANIVLIYLCTELLAIWYLISSIIAFVGAFVVSFSMQKFWTFKNREADRMKKQLGMSLLLALANLGINTLLMYALVEHAHMHYLSAVVLATLLIAVETYFVYKYIIFLAAAERKSNI